MYFSLTPKGMEKIESIYDSPMLYFGSKIEEIIAK